MGQSRTKKKSKNEDYSYWCWQPAFLDKAVKTDHSCASAADRRMTDRGQT